MNTIDQNILDLLTFLKMNGTVRFDVDFCEVVGLRKQNLYKIKQGEARFTANQIKVICGEYHVNANWIFGNSNEIFTKKTFNKDAYIDGVFSKKQELIKSITPEF